MNTIAELLDKMKQTCSIATDMGLAERLAVKRQTVSQWRSAATYPEDERIAQMAKAVGDDPGEWLVRVQVERSSGETRRGYMSILQRIGATMAAAVLFLAPITNDAAASTISPKNFGESRHCVYYVRFRRWSMRGFARLAH